MKYMLLIYGNEENWEAMPPEEVRRARPPDRCAQPRAVRVGRAGRRLRRRRPAHRQGGAGRRGSSGRHRRAVRRGQGVPGQLHDRRLRQPRPSPGDRRAEPGGAATSVVEVPQKPILMEAAISTGDRRRPTTWRWSGGWRRRCSVARAALRPLRRLRGRGAGSARGGQRAMACRGSPGSPKAWLITVASPPVHRPAARRGVPSTAEEQDASRPPPGREAGPPTTR